MQGCLTGLAATMIVALGPGCHAANEAALVVALVRPASGELLTGVVALRAAVEPESLVAAVVFRANGALAGTVLGAPFELLIDTEGLGDGAHVLEAEAVLADGTRALDSVMVSVDNDAPLLSVAEPSERSLHFADGFLRVAGLAADGSGVTRIEVRARGTSERVLVVEPGTGGTWEATFEVAELFPAGVTGVTPVDLTVEAEDGFHRVTALTRTALVRPRLRWLFDTLGEIAQGPAVATDGSVFVASRSGDVFALTEDGGEICRFDGTADDPAISSPVLSPDESIVYFGTERFLRAMNRSCVLLWTYGVEGVWFSTPAVDPVTGTLFAASYDGVVHAISPSGAPLWSAPVGFAGIEAPLVLDSAANTLYVGSLDYRLYALAVDTSEVRWSFLTGREIYAAPRLNGDRVLLASADDYVYSLWGASGTLAWPIGYATGGPVRAPVSVANDGTIYVASQGLSLHALSPDGTMRWQVDVAGLDRAGPAVAPDGTIVVAATDGAVRGFAPDGTEAWSFETFGANEATPVIAGTTVYVASWDRRLYALHASAR